MNHCKDDETGDEVYWTAKKGTPIYDGDTDNILGYLGEPTSVKINAENKITEIAAGEFAVAQDPIEAVRADDARVARDLWGDVASQINQIGKHMEENLKESIRQKIKAPETFQRKAECASRTHIDSPTINALQNAAKWADRRYSKPGTRSVHNKGEAIMEPEWAKPTHDPVNNPSHYTEGREIEPIDAIEDWDLGFNAGQVVKYIARLGRKGDALEDARKARFYLDRLISQLEGDES